MRDPTETPLLEREAELSVLAGAAARAARHEGSVVLIEGPAGIGKSALLEHAGGLAGQVGVRSLRARGSELEGDYAFGLVRQLFEPLVAGLGDAEHGQLFAGAARPAASVFPALAGRAEQPAGEGIFQVLHGLYWMIAELSEAQPITLLVDDAHWSDLSSLRLLAYLANRAADLPLMIVVAARPLGADGRAKLLDELAVNPRTIGVRPAPLKAHSVTELIEGGLGTEADKAFVDACLDATRGNPLFVRELIADLAREGVAPKAAGVERVRRASPDLTRAVLRRLGQLPADALGLARAVAVMGDAPEVAPTFALAGLDAHRAAAATDALVHAQVLRGDRLGFAHPVMGSAIYSDLPPGERSAMHARAARLLAADGAGEADVALHLLQGRPAADPWTVDVLRRAARHAAASGAPEVAVTYLERALAEPPPPEERASLLRELGRQAVTRHPTGYRYLSESIQLTQEPVARAALGLELGQLLFMQSSFEQSAAVLEKAAAELQDAAPELRRAIEAQLYVVALPQLQHVSRLGGLDGIADRISRGGDIARDPAALGALAWIEVMSRPPVGAGAARASTALAGMGDSPESQASVLAGVGPALMAADRLEEAKFIWDAATAESRRRGSLAALAFCFVMRAPVEIRMGDAPAVEADANELLELGRQLDVLDAEPVRLPYAWLLAPLIDALLIRGDVAAAARAFDESPISDEFPEQLQFNYLLDSLGRLRVAQGRGAEAVRHLRECGRRLQAWGVTNPGLVPWRSHLALALLSVGDHDEARALVEEEIALARKFEVPRALGVSLRVGGLVVGGDEGSERLSEAVAVLSATPARVEHAEALVALGSALRRRGNRADARDPLRAGLDLARRSRAPALAQVAHTELVATGARPRRMMLTGLDALTTSERRIAEMAAQGLTNRQIAQTLFVTEKTVEGHLHAVFRKLDVDSRTQLPEALSRDE